MGATAPIVCELDRLGPEERERERELLRAFLAADLAAAETEAG